MIAVWLLTIAANIALAVELVWREHYLKFSYLTTATILSVIIDAWFWFARTYHHSVYMPSRGLIFFVFLGINALIILESRNERRVRIPIETYFIGMILLQGFQHTGLKWTIYYVDCGLRILNLFIIVWLIILFSRTPEQLRTEESYERERRKEAHTRTP
jgi:hypothetical protein